MTYDVVSVWDGAFFRLDQHMKRFRNSMEYFRLVPRETDADIRAMLHELVGRTGLHGAYVAMDCLRGSAPTNLRRHPANAKPYLLAHLRALCLAGAAGDPRAGHAPDRRLQPAHPRTMR